MFFSSIKRLLQGNDAVRVDLSTDGELITVTVQPMASKGASEGALKLPLVLTGTADELDAGFVDAISQFSSVRKSLADQLAQTKAVLESATKQSAATAVKAIQKNGAPATNVENLGEDDSGSDPSVQAEEAANESKETEGKKAPASSGSLDLSVLL